MQVITSRKFDKKIRKQTVGVQKAFKEKIALFVKDVQHPLLNTHKLSGGLKDLWSFNVSGDVRVVFDKLDEDIVMLIDIGTHSQLYK